MLMCAQTHGCAYVQPHTPTHPYVYTPMHTRVRTYTRTRRNFSDNKSAYNDDKYFETYKVNKQQLFHLGQAFQDVYTDEYVDVINNDEKEVKQDSKEYEISDSTPIIENTLVWFSADGQPISSTKVDYENKTSSDITYPIKKVYTTIAYNRTDKDSLAVNNYTKGLIRFFDQEDLVG